MNEFQKAIESLSLKHSIIQVFDDFMELCICSLSQGKMEDRFTLIAKGYDKDEMDILGGAFGHLLNEYTEITETGAWGDVLGTFFMATNSGRAASKNGQFFTPIHICNLMVGVFNGKADGSQIINDPSCGSGRNLIAHAHFDKKNQKPRFYVGMDLDKRCVNMTALNMAIYGMDGIVLHMDSIMNEVFSGYRVFAPATKQGIYPLTKEECLTYLFELKQKSGKTIKNQENA